jgi:ParB-like chromosome segregation protein Spo0J
VANNLGLRAGRVIVLQRVQCKRAGCPRPAYLCYACAWGPVACSPECLAAWQLEQRAASYWKYRHSDKGREKTKLRVRACRAEKRSHVTHTTAQKVGPPTIVSPRDTAPSAVEAGAMTVPGEETIHEEDRAGDQAHAEPAESVYVAQDEQAGDGSVVALAAPRAVAARAVGEREDAVGPRCARCGRVGIEAVGDDVDVRYARPSRPAQRTGGASCAMTSAAAEAKPCPIASIGTTLERARCRQPARIERMKQSLATHGQLTPVVATTRPEGITLVDGFKRLWAAERLGWPTLVTVVRPLDETGQWAVMLLLNRGAASMTTLEEALVLRELCKTGLSQTEVAALCARHKAWVSRRIGLVERLHPELCEAMKLGQLHPGTARRLLSLPPGNQLEMAAAIQGAGLGPRDTELLVGLWRRTKEQQARRALLEAPQASLRRHYPETRRSPLDPRLSPEGQRLCRCLHRLEAVSMETSRRLLSASAATDRAVLSGELRKAAEAASRLAIELGSARIDAGAGEKGESGGTR